VAVDVLTEIEIERPREVVAAFATDPDNAPAWYANIQSVSWRTPRPATIGSQIEFHARFLGRTLVYTYEVRELTPGERLLMSTAQGPFPMETSYEWKDAPGAATLMTLRNRGEPSGFSSLTAPVIERAMRRANRRDLARLKGLLERDRAS
jgi:uncharacterized membrane protein